MKQVPAARNPTLTRITDVHIHIQPWRDLKPEVQEAIRRDKEAHCAWASSTIRAQTLWASPTRPTRSPKYAQANPERLLPYGGVHARLTQASYLGITQV